MTDRFNLSGKAEKIHLGIGEYLLCDTFMRVWNRNRSNFGRMTTENKSEVTCKRCLSKLEHQTPYTFLKRIKAQIGDKNDNNTH